MNGVDHSITLIFELIKSYFQIILSFLIPWKFLKYSKDINKIYKNNLIDKDQLSNLIISISFFIYLLANLILPRIFIFNSDFIMSFSPIEYIYGDIFILLVYSYFVSDLIKLIKDKKRNIIFFYISIIFFQILGSIISQYKEISIFSILGRYLSWDSVLFLITLISLIIFISLIVWNVNITYKKMFLLSILFGIINALSRFYTYEFYDNYYINILPLFLASFLFLTCFLGYPLIYLQKKEI